MQVERASSDVSGARVRNTWITNPLVRDNAGKLALIPGVSVGPQGSAGKGSQGSPEDGSASHQLVGEVMAHQGKDG